jgi:hypothetical protein
MFPRIPLLITGALSLSAAPVGIVPDAQYTLPDHDFAAGLGAWTPAGSGAFQGALAPDGSASARAVNASGEHSSLTLVLPVGVPGSIIERLQAAGIPGEAVEFGARLWVGAGAGVGSAGIRVSAWDGAQLTLLAETPAFAPALAPLDHALALHTVAVGATDGRVPAGTIELRVELFAAGTGTFYFDDVVAGRAQPSEYTLANGDFERPLRHWVVRGGSIGGSSSAFSRDHGLVFGDQPGRAFQTFAIGAQHSQPWHLESSEAGVWVRIEPGSQLGLAPDPAQRIELSLFAPVRGAPPVRIAYREWLPTSDDIGKWRFVQTEPLAAIPLESTHLRLELNKDVIGGLCADFAQAGEVGGIDGNHRKLALASYVGWYRSPLAVEAIGVAQTARERFGNWAWLTPPSADPTNTALAHNPDCLTSPACFRPNGRRDVAISTEGSPDDLPLVGAYDSRDTDVVRYHTLLARAIGIDAFVYTWNGRALAEQSALPGEEDVNARTLDALVDAASAGGDLKVAIQYEPKVHMLGWVAGEPTFAARKAGIVSDLVWLVEQYDGRRGMLQKDGRLVVFLFWQNVCMPAGACLQDSDWVDIGAAVRNTTGRELAFVGTNAPAASTTPIAGLLRWGLVGPSLLRYASYADFNSGQPSLPLPTANDLRQHARANQSVARTFAAGAAGRFAVSMVWPGFDDSGVAGWGQDNGSGTDGLPLSVRVCDDLGGDFLGATLQVALESEAEWMHIATWNDWSERTAVEPVWDARWHAAASLGLAANPQDEERAFARAFELQAGIAAFKGRALDGPILPSRITDVARAYLMAARVGQVIAFD